MRAIRSMRLCLGLSIHKFFIIDLFGYLSISQEKGRSLDEVSQFLEIANERSLLLLRGGCALNLICYKRNKYWLTR